MNYKRAVFAGVMLWGIIFIVISILMFLPYLQGNKNMQFMIFWALLLPITLLLNKWYFKMDPPNLKKGIKLGVILLVVGTLLDLIITVPLFVKSYSQFFGDWMMYVGYVEVFLLSAVAGWEFDRTYTKSDNKEFKK